MALPQAALPWRRARSSDNPAVNRLLKRQASLLGTSLRHIFTSQLRATGAPWGEGTMWPATSHQEGRMFPTPVPYLLLSFLAFFKLEGEKREKPF